MKNTYEKLPVLFFAYFRLHHFKNLSYRKLANICKSMQICKLFVQKNKKITNFWVKYLHHRLFFSHFQFFLLFEPA